MAQVIGQKFEVLFSEIGYEGSRCRDGSGCIIGVNDLVSSATNRLQQVGDALVREESDLLEQVDALLVEDMVSSFVSETKAVHHGTEG